MSDLRGIKTKLSGAALLVVLALASGCGSSGEDTTATSAGGTTATAEKRGQEKQGGNEPCTPRRLPGKVEDPPRSREQGEPISIEVGKTKAMLEVQRTALPSAIPVPFGEREPFKAPQGSMLVAVTYRLASDGPGPVKPSENLNAQLLLRTSGAQYPYATELPCGIPLTASWALERGDANPARPVEAGEETTTAVVFIVPKQEPGTRMSLVVPGQVGIALQPAA